LNAAVSGKSALPQPCHPLLHQHVEFGTMLVDCSPQQIRLAAQRHKHLVPMPCAARLAPHRFDALGESSAELVAPATDRLVRDLDTTLEQQFLDVAQAQTEPEIPANLSGRQNLCSRVLH
jgi:hypothetical protein